MQEANVLSSKQISEVFLNIEQLLQFSGQLLADLTRWCDPALGDQRPHFLTIILSIMAHLPLFNEYFVNSNVSIIKCASLSEKDSSFKKFLSKRKQFGKLEELLELPILRLCKYPVLFNNLVKNSPNPAYKDKIKQHSVILETWVEEHVRQNRMDTIGYEQLSRVSDRIDGFEAAVPGRAIIHEGFSLCRAGAKASSYSSHLFLFNDLLAVTTPKKFNKKKFDFKFHILLDSMTTCLSGASDTESKNYWFRVKKLDNEMSEYDFSVKTPEARVSWLGYLTHVIQERGGMADKVDQSLASFASLPDSAATGDGSLRRWATARTKPLSKEDYKESYKKLPQLLDSSGEQRSSGSSGHSRRRSRHHRRSSTTPIDAEKEIAELKRELFELKNNQEASKLAFQGLLSNVAAKDTQIETMKKTHQKTVIELKRQLAAETVARRAIEDKVIEKDEGDSAALAAVAAELEAMRALVDILVDDGETSTR